MPIKALAYNTLDAFGDPGRIYKLLELIRTESPDIAFFSEAYESSRDVSHHLGQLRGMGYIVTTAPYDDRDGRRDHHNFIGLSRLPGAFTTLRYATRNGWYGLVTVDGKTLNVLGLHANDRHEQGRLAQARSLPEINRPTIMMGDLNAMHGDTIVARVARALRPIVRLLPSIEPAELNVKQPLIPRLGNLAQRFSEMASGTMLSTLEHHGLYDADPRRQPTIHGLAQLDHFLISKDVTVRDFAVLSTVSLSDHKPITVTLDVV